MQNNNPKVKSDLRERCYRFSLSILRLTDSLPAKRSAYVIADQLIRSASSVGANLIEGRAASSRLEFKRYYESAITNANETVYWLSLLRDPRHATTETIEQLHNAAEELTKMLAVGVIKLKQPIR